MDREQNEELDEELNDELGDEVDGVQNDKLDGELNDELVDAGMTSSSCGEVGAVPGTYRLMDLFCLREVLNQIMKCSCQVRIYSPICHISLSRKHGVHRSI